MKNNITEEDLTRLIDFLKTMPRLTQSENVRAFIPGFRNLKKAALPFSLRNVMKREYHGIFNMVLVFAILDLVRNYKFISRFTLNSMWFWVLIVCFAFWLIVRIVVKATPWLDVSGR